jgi:hypothetical protein
VAQILALREACLRRPVGGDQQIGCALALYVGPGFGLLIRSPR